MKNIRIFRQDIQDEYLMNGYFPGRGYEVGQVPGGVAIGAVLLVGTTEAATVGAGYAGDGWAGEAIGDVNGQPQGDSGNYPEFSSLTRQAKLTGIANNPPGEKNAECQSKTVQYKYSTYYFEAIDIFITKSTGGEGIRGEQDGAFGGKCVEVVGANAGSQAEKGRVDIFEQILGIKD